MSTRRHLRSEQDLLSGLVFLVGGGGFAWAAHDYPMGDAGRFGPGFFPFWLGLALVALGLFLMLRAVVRGRAAERIPSIDWRTMLWISGSAALFGLILVPLGLPIATLVLTVVSSAASREFRWKSALVNGLVLATFVTVTFVSLLGLPLPTWPFFFG
jgi:hypothetical protein